MPGQAGPRFYGLITGGVTPAAHLADMLVSSYDPCVQVHWPVSRSAPRRGFSSPLHALSRARARATAQEGYTTSSTI